MEKRKKIKKFCLVFCFIIIFLLGIGICIFLNSKRYYSPQYNSNYITGINIINIVNKDIKNKYQFVFLSDLHASILDENEKDEQIKKSLIERRNLFASLNPNNCSVEEIFEEIINYTNNSKADALLLSGDIIDSPANSNINFLRQNLKNLKTKYLYTLGNHDWSFAWEYHTQKTKETFRPKFNEFMDNLEVSYLEYKDLIVLAIDDSTNQISESSLEKIKNILEKNKPTIAMLHVPINTEYIKEETLKIRNIVSSIGGSGIKIEESTQKAIDMILSEKYKVFYIISGHIHINLQDKIGAKNIPEVISAPAYEGKINLIKINN